MVFFAYKFLPWAILLLSARISEKIKYISRSTPLQQETDAVHIVEPLLNKSLVWMGLWLSTFIPAYTFVAAVLLFTFLDQQSTCRSWHCLYSGSQELSCWAVFKVTQAHHEWCHKGQIVLSVCYIFDLTCMLVTAHVESNKMHKPSARTFKHFMSAKW